jgi:hypothetical protein
MDTSSLRRIRARGAASGFTLLEVMFAVIVMNILVTVSARQLIAHHELVTVLEEWCEDDPVYYVDPQPDPLHRAAEVPADLRQVKPNARWIAVIADGNDVEITAVKRDLATLTTKAEVIQTGP